MCPPCSAPTTAPSQFPAWTLLGLRKRGGMGWDGSGTGFFAHMTEKQGGPGGRERGFALVERWVAALGLLPQQQKLLSDQDG